jgi:hypothetical protein
MANLIYSAITSLDGYIEDRDGHFDWSAAGHESRGASILTRSDN